MEGNMGRERAGTGADWMRMEIRNVGNGERMEGRTGVYKVGGTTYLPTSFLVGAQTTLLYHKVRGSGALGRVKDPIFGILLYYFLY
jgi:hypothetical protein